MAWQLIYTSASRLLEAGLTGFGSVARHRAIPPLVVKAVERISQFARLPGYDSTRLIYCHRVLTVGGARFHVLSRLRDAGSDYSGRTNHIAHHLIAPASEITALTVGVTPADVLLQMPWLDRWDRSPEWFEAAQEVALSGFAPANADRAWESVTGNAEHRWLLVHGTAAKGCCLIVHTHADLLAILAASQHCQSPPQGWQAGFTTSLQPGDDLGDFRWIGIAADSPLRGAVSSSGRPVLDLTTPSTLPAPEIPRTPPPALSQRERSGTATPVIAAYAPPPPPHARGGISNPSSSSPGRHRLPIGGGSRQESGERSWLLPALVAVVVLAGAASAWFLTRGPSGKLVPVSPNVSQELQQSVALAKSAEAIRKIKIPTVDNETPLAKFIKVIHDAGKPATFREALVSLQRLDGKLKDDLEVGSAVKDIFERLEDEAWRLCHAQLEKPSLDDLAGYQWTSVKIGKNAAAAQRWLRQPGSSIPEFSDERPLWMTAEASATVTASPSAAPVNSGASESPSKPTENETSKVVRVSIFKDWSALESLDVGKEWLTKMEAVLPDGSLLGMTVRDNGFREPNGGLRFGLKDGRLIWRDQVDYRRVDLISEKDHGIWRLLHAEASDFAKRHAPVKLKSSDGLRWNKHAATFELTAEVIENLAVYHLADDQRLVLECPFTVDAKKGRQISINGEKSESVKPWLEQLILESEEKPEDTEKFKKLMKELETERKKMDTSIKGLGAKQSDREERVKGYEASFETAKTKVEAEIVTLKSEFAQQQAAITKHPLFVSVENGKLPASGPYAISLKPSATLPSVLLRLIELSAE